MQYHILGINGKHKGSWPFLTLASHWVILPRGCPVSRFVILFIFPTVSLLDWFKTKRTSLPNIQDFFNFHIPFLIVLLILIHIHSLLIHTCRTSTWPIPRLLPLSTHQFKNMVATVSNAWIVLVVRFKWLHINITKVFNWSIIDGAPPESSIPRPSCNSTYKSICNGKNYSIYIRSWPSAWILITDQFSADQIISIHSYQQVQW